MTRFADMFFLIGILIFGYYTGSYNFSFTGTEIAYGAGASAFTVADSARALAAGGMILPTALVLMFIGGAGKSAMFPLHIWLPDAMEASDTGICTYPRRYHGCCRCVPDCTSLPGMD